MNFLALAMALKNVPKIVSESCSMRSQICAVSESQGLACQTCNQCDQIGQYLKVHSDR